MGYQLAGKLLMSGVMALTALTSAGIASADNEQGVVRATEPGVVNAGPSETRTSDIGTARGPMGEAATADQGVTLGTGGLTGKSTESPVAKVKTCANNVNETFAGGLLDTPDLGTFLPYDIFAEGPNVDC